MTDLEKKFLGLLQAALQHRASDIHLATGSAPALRTADGLVPVSLPPFSAEEMQTVCQFMVQDPKQKALFQESCEIDGSFEVKGIGRFRFNVYRTVNGLAAVARVIATKVPTIDELRLPPQLKKIAGAARGLVLVTGATGSGKSSTLAAMIDHLNTSEALHILTVEDPIEFLHPQKKSRVSQREIGRDTGSFAAALRSALRQDPDVILVGEMRDIETLDIALKAAETGHLVFSTVHTSDAMKTVGRLISLFPPEEQQSARIRLADNLHAVISQRLVPSTTGAKVVAQEIMINNLGIHDCILDQDKTSEIPGFIEKGREVSGMQTFDQHLGDMVHAELITMETALEYATNPADFQRNFAFGGTASLDDGAVGGMSGLSYEDSLCSPGGAADDPAPSSIPGLQPLPDNPAGKRTVAVEISPVEEPPETPPAVPRPPKLPGAA